MFRIEMLPAREGDCFLLTYGKPGDEHRVLIDGGREATYKDLKTRLSKLPESEQLFELVIVTHVDRDHIEGILEMVEDRARPITFRDLWFNGYDHLRNVKLETFGALQGERLSAALLDQRLPWNKEFEGRAVETAEHLTTITLEGGLKLTVLSPNRTKLEALIPQWEAECLREGLIRNVAAQEPVAAPAGFEAFGGINITQLAREQFVEDPSKTNGSSIAVLAEYDGKRLLLAGDAHASLIESSLQSLAASEGGRLRIDAMKVSHHGSSRNTSQKVLDLISCPKYLLSTSGAIHHHPDNSAIARLIKFGGAEKELVFNYTTTETVWNKDPWKAKHHYTTSYPSPTENGTAVVEL